MGRGASGCIRCERPPGRPRQDGYLAQVVYPNTAGFGANKLAKIGWLPYLLERLEYQILESRHDGTTIKSPTEAFRDHAYACFWFEEIAPMRLLTASDSTT